LGKWHLAGEGSQKTTNGVVDARFHPDHQGFDINIGGCAYGHPASYFSPYKNATITDGPDNEYLTDRLGDEAYKFIENNKNERFLLYLSFYTVHTPLQAPEDIVEKYNGNKYYAMIDQLDKNVGKVLDKINELKLNKNTLIVFYSDNGGTRENPPLKNRKGSLNEGGIRVPLIFSLPGTVPEGTMCDIPAISHGWRGLGIWTRGTIDSLTARTFVEWSKYAGIKYWKIDVGGIENFWSFNIKEEIFPELTLEYVTPAGNLNPNWDVPGQKEYPSVYDIGGTHQ